MKKKLYTIFLICASILQQNSKRAMLKNDRSDASLERTAIHFHLNEAEFEKLSISRPPKTSGDGEKNLEPRVCNRDSGVFEDFVSPPLLLQENKPPSLAIKPPSIDPESEDEVSTSYDTDRDLHASLSSLDTAAASTSLSLSLSSLTSSEEEEVDDFDLSPSSDSEDDDLSDHSSQGNDSNSFGYHSLLNDLTPDEDNGSVCYDPKATSFYTNTRGRHTVNLDSISPAFSCDGNNSPQIEEDLSGSTFSISYPSSPDGFSFDSSDSSEEENPSNIEFKMAETKVKMNDAILSSGREELCSRKLKLFKIQMEGMIDTINCNQICNDRTSSQQSNNKINNNKTQLNRDKQHLYEETAREKLNLPIVESRASWGDNRFNSSEESPIVDAYEKECKDVPEKMAREMDKENQDKEVSPKEKLESISQMDLEHDRDLQAFEAVMKEAIKSKEAGYQSSSHIPFDVSDDYGLRHRPSPQQRRRERNALRRAIPQPSGSPRDKKKLSSPDAGEFDVYTMETALPKIDWEAIEAHLNATREEEMRRRTDREEIRRKLAMGNDEDFRNDRQAKKPSLQSRLQNGKNLQICFMNETASDCESQCSDTESTQDRIDDTEGHHKDGKGEVIHPKYFSSYQAKLQEEARLALAQAKEMARMQMHLEKQNRVKSPITEIVRGSFCKVGFPFPESKRRMSRLILTDMNVAQLQVIVNDFHTQIENLNEVLVELLLKRDDLHMEQDSMLVDIEDLTKHLGAKEQLKFLKTEGKNGTVNGRNKTHLVASSMSSKSYKLKSFVKK